MPYGLPRRPAAVLSINDGFIGLDGTIFIRHVQTAAGKQRDGPAALITRARRDWTGATAASFGGLSGRGPRSSTLVVFDGREPKPHDRVTLRTHAEPGPAVV